ncbi:hypothetical protein AAC387_Pa02g3107 [Persea americana]
MGTKVHCKSYLPGYYSMRDLNENGQYFNCFMPMAQNGYLECDKEVLKQIILQHEAIFRKQVFELHRLYKIQRDLMNELQRKELCKYSITTETSPFNPFSFHRPSEDTQKMRQMPTVTAVNSTYSRSSFYGTEDRQSPLHLLKESKVQSDSGLVQNGIGINDYDLLGSKVKKFQKRMFDLQLPADAYIDGEEGEGTEKRTFPEVSLGSVYSQNKKYGIESEGEGDMSLNLGTGDKMIHGGDDKKIDCHLQSSHNTHCLADLNEPIPGICIEEASALASVNHVGPVSCQEGIQGQELPMEQKNLSILGVSKDFSQDNRKCRDEWSLPDLMHSKNEEHKRKWLAHSLEAGQSRVNPSSATSTFCHEKWNVSSAHSQADIKKAHELPKFLASDRGRRETWFGGKATCAEMTKRDSSHTVSKVIEQVAAPISPLHSAVSRTDDANTASPSVSPWRKPADCISQVPLAAVQALPCLNGSLALDRHSKSSNSSLQCPGIKKDMWDLNVSLSSHLSSMTELPCRNGYNYGFQSESSMSIDKLNLNCSDCSSYEHNDVPGHGKLSKGMHCTDMNSVKDMNLNLSVPNGCKDGISSIVDHVQVDGEGKHGDPFSRVSWVRTKSTLNQAASIGGGFTQKDLGWLRGCSQVVSSGELDSQPFHSKIEKEKGPSGSIKDFTYTIHTKDAEANKIALANGTSRKIFGFPALTSCPILEDPCPYSSLPMSSQNQFGIADSDNGVPAGLPCVDTSSKPSLLNLEKKLLAEDHLSEKESDRSSTDFRGHINLNSVPVTSKEQPPESLEIKISSENDRDALIPSVPEPTAEFAAEIDLEAPVILSHGVKDIPTESETLGCNQSVKLVQLEHCETDSNDTLVKTAVEAILAMSTCNYSHLDDASYLSSSALKDSLLWFSEVVSLNSGELEGMVAASKGRGDADSELSDDGVDFFEAMTLKLTEMQVEECCWKPWDRENLEEEETRSSKLLTRPRRTQRRGRQRRDFQKDILPSLVSLSRHEVTEDLQIIEGLMIASGYSWQTGMTRKNAARNGWHCRGRGRRRPRGSAAAGMGNWGCLLPRQSSNEEIELEGGISLQGWGKTTRRCRRQRFPSSNASTALT